MIQYLFFFFINVQSVMYGIYSESIITKAGIDCLSNLGFTDFFVHTGYYGDYDDDKNETVNRFTYAKNVNEYALEAGFSSTTIEITFKLCYECDNYLQQIETFLEKAKEENLHFEILWFVIDQSWGNNQRANRMILTTLANSLHCVDYYCGIKTSFNDWGYVFGDMYTFPKTSSWYLWYTSIDYRRDFKNFESFGGWNTPYMKEFKTEVNICGHMISYNFKL